MIISNTEKLDYSILNKTEFKEIDDYIYLENGFSLTENNITFTPEIKNKIDNMRSNYKMISYRLRNNENSLFFTDDDIKNDNPETLLRYAVTNVNKNEKYILVTTPINTRIKTNNDSYVNLNNKQIKLFYSNIVPSAFDLNGRPKDDILDKNGNYVHYITNTNTVLISTEDGYKNIKDIILDEKVTYHETYETNINDKQMTLNDVLIYEGIIIGSLTNTNKISLNNILKPSLRINGIEFDISNGVNAVEDKVENLIYYENLDKLVAAGTYNEYDIGNFIYYKDLNKLFLCQKNGLLEIDYSNVIFSYDSPLEFKNGSIWFNMNLSTIHIFNGLFWTQMNRPSIKVLFEKIRTEKAIDYYGTENSLEIFAYDKNDEFQLIEMYVSNDVVTDIEFDLEDQFIESVFINGKEIYTFHDASWGMHLFNPILKGDFVQIIVSKKKKYDWVLGNVENMNTVLITHPYEVESVKKIFINDRMYNITGINHNRININDIINNYKEPLILNECDRVYAKVKLTKNISTAYPSFVVPYKQNCKEVELPFYIPEHRFDKLMITNNSETVLVNPQVILKQDDLYVRYDIKQPNKITFSRYIRKDDNIIVQFIPHKICLYNPESFLTGIQTKEDIHNSVILDSIISFEDEKVSMNLLYEEIDRLNYEAQEEEKILFDKFENNGVGLDDCDGEKPEDPDEDLGDNISNDAGIPAQNEYTKTNIPLPMINDLSKSDEINKIIESSTLKSNPDSTTIAMLNKSTPPKINKPVLCKPSQVGYRPVVKVYLKDPIRYSKYNLQITRDYFRKKDELQNYLVGISEKFANMVADLAKMRDSLRAIVNYICNILCIADILKTIVELFKMIGNAIKNLLNFKWKELWKKMNKFFEKIGNKIKEFIKKMKEAIKDAIGNIMQSIADALKALDEALNKLLESIADAFSKIGEIGDQLTEVLDKLKSLFNKFNPTTIGLKIGSFFKKVLDAILLAFKKIAEAIAKAIEGFFKLFSKLFDLLAKIKAKLMDFTIHFKDFTMNLTIDGIMNLICHKILGTLMNLFDNLVDILEYLQLRFQDFLNKLFADRYRPKTNVVDKLISAGDFFKSHIDLCEVLAEMLLSKDFTLAGFIKRVTTLYKVFRAWAYNRDVLKGLYLDKNVHANDVEGLSGAVSDMESLFVSIDEMFGLNKSTIEKLIKKLYKGFIPNFKKTTESVLDVQAMSKQLFDTEKFINFYHKLITI